MVAEGRAEGRSGVALPDALERKYPRAGHSRRGSGFAQHTHSTDPRSGVVRRHHMYDQTFQRAFKRAVEGTVAKLAMRQPFVLFKGLTFQKLCLPAHFARDHHNKMLRPGLCVVHASPQYL